jgi:ankyrin repeat protein
MEEMKQAIECNNIEWARQLIARGVNLNDEFAADYVCEYGTAEMAQLLMDNDVDFSKHCYSGMCIAAYQGNIAMIKFLLSNVDIGDETVSHLMYNAAGSGSMELLQLLVDAGADASADESAALFAASNGDHPAAVELLLEEGADIAARGNIAVRTAAREGYSEVIAILVAASSVHPGVRYYNDGGTVYILHAGEGESNVPGYSIFCTGKVNYEFINRFLENTARKKSAM